MHCTISVTTTGYSTNILQHEWNYIVNMSFCSDVVTVIGKERK